MLGRDADSQMAAPSKEFLPRQGSTHHHSACAIDGVNLNNALGQIDPNSCNLAHGLLLFGFRWTLSHLHLGT
jgi:hypothetical protein